MRMRRIDVRGRPDLEIPRPASGAEPVADVREIIERVRSGGDAALVKLTERFDGVSLEKDRLQVNREEIEMAVKSASSELIGALEEAAMRIRVFAQSQVLKSWNASVDGGRVGEVVHPVERAGIYVPGGRAAYPSTVLMGVVPAAVAGVPRIVLCTPPGREGDVPAATLVAARVAGVEEIYRVGGAQAIAALAFGTETIPKVDVIAGPGNIYVAVAKREVAGLVGIESVAGPSEIAIVADGTADPRLLALDLVAQAEHGPGGSFLLVTSEETVIGLVEKELDEVLLETPASPAELTTALEEGLVAVLVSNLSEAIDVLSQFAPEHVELVCREPRGVAEQVRNAGAVFVGGLSPVSLGDYLAGSNHVLPTGGAARWASGLRASHFQRTMAVIEYDSESLKGTLNAIRALAEAEGLPNHARAVEARFLDDR
jgi:histidinol dehydrogenase